MGSLFKRFGLIELCATVALLLYCNPVQAHKVTVFAWVEGDTVHVESKFSGGRRPAAVPVEVYDSQDTLLLKGATDENGEFSFKVPKKTEMKVVVLAGMGHKGQWTIPLSELENAGTVSADKRAETMPQSPQAAGPVEDRGAATAADKQPAPPASIGTEEIRGVVEEALETQLRPLIKLMAETHRSGPSLTDILGGIGYIFGLIGVAAYVNAKRRES
jgi:nickel transport protein